MPYGILDRAAAFDETALPANIGRVQTDAFDFNRPEHILYRGTQPQPKYLRYVGAATYYRCDAPPPELQNSSFFLHFPNDANAPPGGSWFMLEDERGENDLFQFGGVHSTYGDWETGGQENLQAIYDHMDFRASNWYSPHHVLYIPAGWFSVADTVVCKAGTVHLDGKREARDGAKSCLAFKDDKDWFIVHYDNTSGDTSSTQQWEGSEGDRRSGAFSIFRGFGIFGEAAYTKDYRAKVDGITLRARATINNMWLSGATRHGIHVVTSISAAMDNPRGEGNEFAGGNANSTRITDNSIQWCGGSGIRCIGADSNAVTIANNEENFCGWSGVEETSFLGPNGVLQNHTTDCGISVGSTYAWGYKHDLRVDHQTKAGCYAYVVEDGVRVVYIARGPGSYQYNEQRWRELCEVQPGTNEDVWAYYAHDTNPGMNTPSWFAKEWLPDQEVGTYVWAAPRFIAGVTNYSGSIFCYDEGSQPPAQIYTPRGTHRGNASGGFILRGSSGDIWDEGTTFGPVKVLHSHWDQTAKKWNETSLTLLAEEGGLVWVDKVYDTNWGDWFTPGRTVENGDLNTRYGSQPSAVVASVIGSSNRAKDGSGRSLHPGTHVFGRFAVAMPWDWAWNARRIVVRMDNEIKGGNSAFEGLGVGDIVLPAVQNNPADPYDDNDALVPGGFGASVIIEAPDPVKEKRFVRLGKLGDTVLGSIPDIEPPPPPPPPPPPSPSDGDSIFNRVDSSLSVQDAKATKTSAFGNHAKAIVGEAAGSGIRSFEVLLGHVGDIGIGVATAGEPLDGSLLGSNAATSSGLWNNGWTQDNNGSWVQVAGFADGNTVRFTLNTNTKEATWAVNGTVVLTRTLAVEGPVFPAVSLRYEGDTATVSLTPTGLPSEILPWV